MCHTPAVDIFKYLMCTVGLEIRSILPILKLPIINAHANSNVMQITKLKKKLHFHEKIANIKHYNCDTLIAVLSLSVWYWPSPQYATSSLSSFNYFYHFVSSS